MSICFSKSFLKKFFHIIIKTTVCVGKNAIRTPENTDYIIERLTYDLRFNMTSITMLVSYLLNIFVLIYPYTMLSRETILTNPSVKYIINKYETNDKFGKYADKVIANR